MRLIFPICELKQNGFHLSVESNSFVLALVAIGLKISRNFLNQSEVKPKLIVARAYTFSRASCPLHVFVSSFDWFTALLVSFVIGQSDYTGFGFTMETGSRSSDLLI